MRAVEPRLSGGARLRFGVIHTVCSKLHVAQCIRLLIHVRLGMYGTAPEPHIKPHIVLGTCSGCRVADYLMLPV